MKLVFLPLMCLVLLAGCGGEKTTDAYVAEIDQWHTARVDRLKSDTGWLTLVGLHPLKMGANSVGASADADVVMEGGAPYWLGTLGVTTDEILFSVHPDATVEIYGEESEGRLASISLATDKDHPPTVLSSGSLLFYVIDRAGNLFLRVKDRKSPVLQSFTGIDRYPVDVRWRVTARLEGGPTTIAVPDVLGHSSASPSPGVLVFEIDGRELRLTPTGEPGEAMFLVFGDASNGQGTYPGGRFLAVEPPAEDGTVTIDFNRAYNPPCVFTPYATCPLPAPANTLPVAVAAGEKMWGGHH